MTPAIAIVILFVVGWFAGGTIWNIRKGSAAMRWMHDGLPLLGEHTTVRWLGTTAVELVIVKAKLPFQQVTVLIFMEPRDVPWNWGVSRLQGRRDTLIIRAQLHTSPHADVEVVDRASWSGRDVLRRITSERWTLVEPESHSNLSIYYKTEAALGRVNALLDLTRQAGFTVRRLSVRHASPHLQLHVDLPAASTSARDVFETVRELGERASG